MYNFILNIILTSWSLFSEAAPYMILGILVAGFLRLFLKEELVGRHLGQGRYSSVIKASLLGIPIPLCSCGVLPAAAGLKKQGANNGAVTSFMISTPESGVDSIAVSYALLDPLMTVARPVAAFTTALIAGMAENIFGWNKQEKQTDIDDISCGCCAAPVECGQDLPTPGFRQRLRQSLAFSFGELWGDLVGWFFIGILLAGIITVLIPQELMGRYLGGGIGSMLLMLAVGIPIYICATSSTPIAAALILKGVSPGAALVFLLAGPATNVTSLTVLTGILGKRAVFIYLTSLSIMAVLFGLAVDWLYAFLGLDIRAVAGQAQEFMPAYVETSGALFLLALSIKPLFSQARSLLNNKNASQETQACSSGCCGLDANTHAH